MKPLAKVTLMIQDQTLGPLGIDLTEEIDLVLPDHPHDKFLDGPTCRRVATIDFDPATGDPLPPPSPFEPFDASEPTVGRYRTEGLPVDAPESLAVNGFGTVLETIAMFEEPEALGRRVEWAFDGEQLLVVPRAGEWANAFYERATRSLQFYWYSAATSEKVYTVLSRDSVAHECGHALLDAIVPSLYDGSTPESLAIHEAIADLVAVLMALRSKALVRAVLRINAHSIDKTSAFSSIAEQFGITNPNPDDPHPHALRDLQNNLSMHEVNQTNPHELSTVLAAIFYQVLVVMFEGSKQRFMRPDSTGNQINLDNAARSLLWAADIFRRVLLRGIDYFPPGELTFADVARATLAADRAQDNGPRTESIEKNRLDFAKRFVERGVIRSVEELDYSAPSALDVTPEFLSDLYDSEWIAYRFVEQHRHHFGIEKGTPFEVLPRVDATKRIRVGKLEQRELILKVGWDITEPNGVTEIPASERRVRTGATIAWRWSDGRVLALVRSTVCATTQRAARDKYLTNLLQHNDIPVVEGSPKGTSVDNDGTAIRILDDVARITCTQRLLHIQRPKP